MAPYPLTARSLIRWAITVAAFLALALATALSAPASAAGPGSAHVGPGCDPTRTAVAHHAGGAALASTLQSGSGRRPDITLTPCSVKVGPSTETASIGVTSDGTLFYAPWAPTDTLPVPPDTPSMVARSTNSGATWSPLVATSTPPHNTLVPWLDVDPQTNRVWYATLGDTDKCSGTYAHISWSDDQGKTWHNPKDDSCRQLQGGMSVVEGPAPAGSPRPVGYPHVVYHCGNTTDGVSPLSVHCWKSLNGGSSWSYVEGPNNIPNCANERPRGRAVGPDGSFYMSIQCDAGLEMAVSHNEGATWQVKDVAATTINRLDVSSMAVDNSGNVYIVWVAGGTGGAAGVPALGQPYMTASHDHGQTWSSPMRVEAPGVDVVTEVGVAADTQGHVAISYLGSSDEGQNFDGYITESWNANRSNPTFWSASVNSPRRPLMTGATATSAVHGDRMWFITVAFGPDGTPWTALHCSRTAECPQRNGVVGRLVGHPPAGRPRHD